VEVKVGIQMAPRELVVDTTGSAEEVERALTEALADDKVFVLHDSKGNTVLVPAAKVAYVEVGPAAPRQIGFGAS
jgi:hypothetical protein